MRFRRLLPTVSAAAKRRALYWLLGCGLADQAWLRLLPHPRTAGPAHPVRLGIGALTFYAPLWAALIHAALLALCFGGAGLRLWRGRR